MRSWILLLLAWSLVLATACVTPGAGDAAEAETKRMLATITVPATAAVYVAEKPFASNETVRLTDEVGGEYSFTTAAEGQTWFFMVDMEPAERRGHLIKYVFLSDAEVQWVDRQWFTSIQGSGGWEAVRAIDVGEVPAAVIRSVAASAGATTAEPLGAGAALRTISQTKGKRKAIVVDGGDEWLQFPTGLTRDELWKKFERIDAKIEFARQADEFAKALPGHGYSVERLSGLANRGAPAPTPDQLAKSIRDQAAGLGSGDELVLYFGGHGNATGIVFSDKAYGAGLISYAALNAMLEQVPAGVKKVVILDSCQSGAAAKDLKNVELHYAAAEGKLARVGLGAESSYTESLLESLGDPSEKLEDPIGLAAIFADLAQGDRGASTVTRSSAGARTIDLNGVLDELRAQWAKQNPGLTLAGITCVPGGSVAIPAQIACSYNDSAKNSGKIALEIAADSSWSWRANATALQSAHLVAVASSGFREQVGRSMQDVSCDWGGLIPVSTTVSCSYTDPVAGPGLLTITVLADGSWNWRAAPVKVAVTAAPVTAAPARTATPVRTAGPACDNPYDGTSWTGTLDLDFYGEQHYTTTITFRFGSARSGDCESVPVASASVSDGSRSYTLDASQSHMGCAYHRAAPVGTGAYARCETMEFDLKLRLASGPDKVGRFSIDPISVRIQQGGSRVLTPTQISGPGGAGCCDWGTFTATRG